MAGRSSRLASQSRATPLPIEDTQSTAGDDSQSGRQGEGVGIDSDPGATTIIIPHNGDVDVRAPMSLIQMRQTIDNEVLSSEQLQILGERIRELTEIRDGASRKRPRDNSDDDAVATKRKTLDLKYDEVETLTQSFTVRQWAQWKEDLELVYHSASWKYYFDQDKITKALSKMNAHCRSLYHSFKTMKEEITSDYTQFLEWTKSLIKDNANFESSIYDEWEHAKQRQEQSPQLFHTYLASLEAQLPRMEERASAQVFKAKLLPSLRGSMMQSGQLLSITTRIAMVSLAQQSWEGMILRGEMRKPPRTTNDERRDNDNPDSNSRGRNNRGRGGWRGRGGQNHSSNSSSQTGNQGESSYTSSHIRGNGRGRGRGRFPKEFASGRNEKGERTCYRCGSTKHLAHDHDRGETEDAKSAEPKKEVPNVKTIKTGERKKGHVRMAERAWELTDSESDSGNE
jgi:hypothetical protein